MQIIPFDRAHIPEAEALALRCYQEERRHVPALPERAILGVAQHFAANGLSVAAVEDIIIWGLNNGYSFKALDMTSPDAHHGLNN